MLKVFLHHLFADVSRAPCTITDGPEVSAPAPLPQRRIFFLQSAARAPFQPPHQLRQRLRRRILDVHVYMVFTDHALENPHILGGADLHEQVTAANLDVSCEHVIALLRAPHEMCRQPGDGVPTVPLVAHQPRLLSCGRSV